MSTEAFIIVVLIALALAVQSVRRVLSLAAPERGVQVWLLLAAAALGGLLAGSLLSWDLVPVGVTVGLSLLELSPLVSRIVRGRLRKAGDK
jgi:hypothetical protein